ncbi:MAG: tRNA (guanosine(37)-N1)-methyltransferase TrmD [Myxococcales bacterium]|nr:tRNA (guanosine(37)-N1)-methyltransferase TrmD [Myxococcales bacterium]
MRFDVVTLFPEMLDGFASLGVVGRATKGGLLELRRHSPREHGLGRHKNVDDTPYGGGAGMVMRVDCLVDAMEHLDATADGPPAHRILLSPQGRPFDQAAARRLAELPAVMLICGRYEGFDERVRDHVQEEISLGDFVLSGGEIAAMAVIDAVARLLEGVLGNADSLREESHGTGGHGLEYPQYTRPVEYRGARVPDVLQSGHHAAIEAWRREQSRLRTAARRPDLLRSNDEQEP